VLTISIGSILLVSSVFVITNFLTSQDAIERELWRSFDYRNRIAMLSLSELLDSTSKGVTSITEQISNTPGSTSDYLETAKTELNAFSLSEAGNYIDLIALVKHNNRLFEDDLSSPLIPDASQLLEAYVSKQLSEQWQLVLIHSNDGINAALISSRPIIESEYGQVIAHIVFGISLKENMPVLNVLRQDAEVDGIQLSIGGQVMASSFVDNQLVHRSDLLSKSRKTPFGNTDQKLIIRSYLTNTLRSELDAAYIKSLTVFLVISILTALSAYWLIRRITTVGFGRLLHYVEAIRESGQHIDFSPGGIAEFNTLGTAFENMIASVKSSELALKQSEQQQRDLLNKTSSVIYMKDIEGRYLFVNKKYESLFHITDNEIQDKTDYDLFPKEMADAFRVNDLEALDADSIIEREEVVPQDDGNHTYISVKFPLTKSTGEVYAVCGISTDITDRKLAEEENRQLQNYLSNIIDSMPSILVGVNPEGQITQWNNEAKEVLGLTAEQAIGQSLEQVFPRLSQEMGRIQKSIQTRQEICKQKCPYQYEGETHFEDITIYPLISNGIKGAVIRVDDVTEQVRVEEMMIQSEKMLSVGGLAAGMAHEINNPLAGMVQTADVMKNRLTKVDMPANLQIAKELGISIDDIALYMEKRSITRMVDSIIES